MTAWLLQLIIMIKYIVISERNCVSLNATLHAYFEFPTINNMNMVFFLISEAGIILSQLNVGLGNFGQCQIFEEYESNSEIMYTIKLRQHDICI
jgi:hypothetical protein